MESKLMFMGSMKFDLGEDVNALQEMVHRWAQERVKPMAAEIDKTNEFPNALWQRWVSLVCLALQHPKNTAGRGCPILRM
jgi:isovaleryl-CoA dehydrogenase